MHAPPRTAFAAATLALTAAQVALATPSQAASPGAAVAPYEYLGWGDPQAPTPVMSVMSATGVKWLTLAFTKIFGRYAGVGSSR